MEVAADLRRAASFLVDTLGGVVSGDSWQIVAAPTDWCCRETLDHVANALCGYAVSLANRLTHRRRHHPRNGDPSASPADLLEVIESFAGILAAVSEAILTDRRAFHPAGMADRDGFVAMGCDEILVHGHDVATALGLDFVPPSDLAARVVTRLFPWAPDGADRWAVLLWANGRIALDGRDRLEPDWCWHCAPLSEWNGQPHRRTQHDPPGWR
jgi:hypothetical protein